MTTERLDFGSCILALKCYQQTGGQGFFAAVDFATSMYKWDPHQNTLYFLQYFFLRKISGKKQIMVF